MQIDKEGIENQLVKMVLEKKIKIKKHNSEKPLLHASSLGNGLKRFRAGIY
jgi:hypothetical protein